MRRLLGCVTVGEFVENAYLLLLVIAFIFGGFWEDSLK